VPLILHCGEMNARKVNGVLPSKRPNSRSTLARRPASASLTCSACSPSSRPICARNASLEGIAKAKAAGVYRGRKPSIEAAQVREMRKQGFGATEIAKALGIGRASVYRLLADASSSGKTAPLDGASHA